MSSQVAFNSQRIKTKDENGIGENINHLRRERNGNSRRLSHIDDDHHLSDLRKGKQLSVLSLKNGNNLM